MIPNTISVVISEDYLGVNPIKETVIKDGKVSESFPPRDIPTLLRNPSIRLVSASPIGDSRTIFYLEWIK